MHFPLYIALVPALAIFAQWVAWRSKLPSILLLLGIGIVLGQFISPDELIAGAISGDSSIAGPRLLFPFVSLSVAVIMFEGGLSLKLNELREAGVPALRLCTVGAILTAVLTTFAAHWVLGFHWRLACLLGAVLVVTGPTVIGPLLRQVQPSPRVSNTLKWEGIVIDPIGAVMAVLVFEVLMLHAGDAGLWDAILLLGKTAAIGTIGGVLCGASMGVMIRKYLIPDQLQGVAALALALLLFAVSDMLSHESGLIAVTVMGIWLTNARNIDIEHVVEFQENLRTLLIGCLFIVLASRIDVLMLREVGLPGLIFVAILIAVVRPASVFLSLLGTGMSRPEKSFIALLAPRGIVAAAVSSVFALRIEQSPSIDVPGAEQLAIVTFLTIIVTVAVYGLLASPIASALGVAESSRNGVLILGADPWVLEFATELHKQKVPVVVIDNNYRKTTKAQLAGLTAVCGNILNEHVREELPLSGIGNMLAMTCNDEVNSLAVKECRGLFGRANTFQLTFKTVNRRGMTKNMMGRELFGDGLTHTSIRERFNRGYHFKATRISKEFSIEDFEKMYPNAIFVAVIEENHSLKLVTVDETITPESGQTIVAMVELKPEPAEG